VARVIDWVDVPAGPGRYRSRLVETPAFRVGRTPVTQAQFAAFADEPDVDRWFEGLPVADDDRRLKPATFPGDDRPQDGVSWFAAVAFCRWASARAGGPADLDRVADWPVRLPTDREWEKAARGESKDAYPYGPQFRPEGGNGKHTGLGGTSPVGSFPAGASPYGVLDMSGNVWDWVLSRHDDPDGHLAAVDLHDPGPRVIRGGCYANAPGHLRATYRGKAAPGAAFEILGLRVCTSRPA
jgi:formylglycine-generating enzyme required for sulfatase activity